MSNFLVTGGAGFIGSHIVMELVRQGQNVRVLDNLHTGQRRNLDSVSETVDFIEGDILDGATLDRATTEVDYVIHEAALSTVPFSISDPIATHEINLTGTLNVLLAASKANVKRVVFASTSAVYGRKSHLVQPEGRQTDPFSPYAASKFAAESYCLSYYSYYGLPTVVLRYFNVFGPRQSEKSHYFGVIPRFITAIVAGQSPTINGDGMQSRDFVYVDNVVQATLLACERPQAIGKILDVGSGQSCTVRDVLADISRLMGSDLRPKFTKEPIGEVHDSKASIGEMVEVLNYRPQVEWEDGLKRTVEWYRSVRPQ